RVGLRLVGGREVTEALRVVRMLLDFLLRLRDGRPAAAEDVEAVEELVEPAVPAGADAEEGKGHGEVDGEDEIHRLRPAAHPREEELLVRVPAARVPLAPVRVGFGGRLRASAGLLVLEGLCLLGLD